MGGIVLSGIDTKIMAFVGTENASDLISRLAKYTDKIYAAASPHYGKCSFPGGNITIITSRLDADGIQRWIDRTGIGLIIDGVSEHAEEERELIRKKADENGIEYLKITNHLRMSKNIQVCKSRETLISAFSYSTGIILVEGFSLFLLLKEAGIDPERMIVLTRPDPEEIHRLKEAGCRESQIISFGMIVHEAFLLSLFDELHIRYYVLEGGNNRGIAEKIGALNHSDAHALIDGELAGQEGHTSAELWKMLKNRYGLKD